MVVVEIGCGPSAGPFFEGADEHFIVDSDEGRLATAASQSESFTPVHADARNMEFLSDASVDVVLARNVFGDPILCEDTSVRDLIEAAYLSLVRTEDFEAADRFMADMRAGSSERKVVIMQEASRVLVARGRIIAVEQSPWTAREFFGGLASNPATVGGLVVREAKLSDIAPESYASRHPSIATWVAEK